LYLAMSNTRSAVVLRDTRDVARLKWQLPVLLSMIAGAVDVIGFLSLGLFTAHVTGNIVIIAAHLVHGGPPNVPQIVAVPVFILAVAAVWFIAKLIKSQDAAWGRPLLHVQFALLTCVLILSVVQRPALDRKGLIADVTAIIAVSAMACQYAFLRLAVPGAPSAAVMTGNLTKAVISMLDTLSRHRPLTEGASEQLTKTAKLIAGFFVGCVAGALAISLLADWAWSLPVLLAGIAAILPRNRF
jgi:uncharacterized membrane protein YoaK (UPF0700 family)